jgi:hypothetical protein
LGMGLSLPWRRMEAVGRGLLDERVDLDMVE